VNVRCVWLAAAALGGVLGACATSQPAVDARYVAVHNAMTALGLAPAGPLQQGALAEGAEARLSLDLPAQCTTVMVLGGDGTRDVDVSVVDPDGKTLARDTTHDPQAVVRACSDTAGPHVVTVRMARGAGSFLVSAWAGGTGTGLAAATAAASNAAGTCESPIPLVAGQVQGNTVRGESAAEGTDSCSASRGKELVYKLELPARKRVQIEMEAHFDTMLYVRRDDCEDEDAQVACNDDSGSGSRANTSRVDVVLDPGTYFVFADGSGGESGTFRMNVTLSDVPTLADACRQARPLTPGSTVSGALGAAFDHARASCGGDAKGHDVPYRLDLGQRARVRLVEHSDDFGPVVHVRRTCTDPQAEVGCADTGATDGDATIASVLEPGSYTVFADAVDEDADGHYTLSVELGAEQGSGVPGDACGDAAALGAGSVDGDTFQAKDDFSPRCAAPGTPDVVYRVDLPRRSRLHVDVETQESELVVALQRACGDGQTELACGPALDQVLAPGTYFLIVDGQKPGAMGRFTLDTRIEDVTALEAACKTAPLVGPGQTVRGDTTGAPDKFSSACGGRADARGSGDRVFRIAPARPSRVTLTSRSATFASVVSLRKDCLTGGSGSAEITCNADARGGDDSVVSAVLQPGTYYVVVDGFGAGQQGPFTLEYQAVPIP
jgi:hypothetical protein